jgi:hypothetical protein
MIVKERKAFIEYLRKHTLPEICMYMHIALSGAGEPWDPWEYRAAVKYLRLRLLRWSPSVGPLWREFDECVRRLVEATVSEYVVRSRLDAETPRTSARPH